MPRSGFPTRPRRGPSPLQGSRATTPRTTGLISGPTVNFTEVYPAGFAPTLYGNLFDAAGTLGLKGKRANQLTYDFSGSFAQSRVEYSIRNTLNPSLGPQSPTSFELGSLEERDSNLNADFTYPVEIGLSAPALLAFGWEFRREQYIIKAGEPASYEAGPYARVPLINADGTPALDGSDAQIVAVQSVGANGFPGFNPRDAVDDSRDSYATYVDLEADLNLAIP